MPSSEPAAPHLASSARLYEVLHGLAHRQLRKSSGATLNTTALVHEAWLKLARAPDQGFESRSHFVAVAAMAMRQVLVDYGRRKNAQRRGSGAPETRSSLSSVGADSRVEDLLAIDAALDKLAEVDPRLAKVVEFRFFAGLEEAEIADVLGVNVRTVRRDWRKARAYLLSEMAVG
jgi:RNA polymerase sigma factor (TIGR02999 family)